jgi:hypothetical protein
VPAHQLTLGKKRGLKKPFQALKSRESKKNGHRIALIGKAENQLLVLPLRKAGLRAGQKPYSAQLQEPLWRQ